MHKWTTEPSSLFCFRSRRLPLGKLSRLLVPRTLVRRPRLIASRHRGLNALNCLPVSQQGGRRRREHRRRLPLAASVQFGARNVAAHGTRLGIEAGTLPFVPASRHLGEMLVDGEFFPCGHRMFLSSNPTGILIAHPSLQDAPNNCMRSRISSKACASTLALRDIALAWLRALPG